MTNPNGARLGQEAGRHNGTGRPPSVGLTRRSDGRWTLNIPEPANGGPAGSVDPATTELAVTRARDTRSDADWDVVDHYDPAFEEASSRFFRTDPGNRLTFDHLSDDGSGRDDVDPGRARPHGVNPESPLPGGLNYGPAGSDDPRPERAIDPSYPAGSGYEAVYGEAVVDPTEPEVDEDELATGAAARRNAIEWAVVLVAAVLLALVLRALVLQAFYIPSPSMEDTLLIQDRVLVNKLSYRFGDVGRGDIVVFHRTEEEIASAGPNQPKDVIKRVVALGGETIEIRENRVLINGEELFEPYLDPGLVMPDFGPLTVPEGFLFVMGDNRNLSSDSRGELGPIAEDRVVGRAFVLFWPVNRVSRL